MKKKAVCLLICTTLFLSGCGKQTPMMSYQTKDDTFTVLSQEEAGSNLLSRDVCVIPKEETKDTDKNLTAESALLVDVTDDKKVYAENVYEKLYPASITKIVTALVTLKNAKLDDEVVITKDAANITEPGAKLCGFQEGDKILLKDLLRAFLVYSGNDAGVALAEHVAGSVDEFAELMNKEAENIGASHSHFVNPHGLHDDNHYTTAYDIYLFFNELTKYDTFVDIVNSGRVTVSYEDKAGKKQTKTFESTDRYLNGKMNPPAGVTVIGGKTGTTSKAGSCLVLYSEGSSGHRYISVVLKAQSGDDLFTQMNYLLGMIK